MKSVLLFNKLKKYVNMKMGRDLYASSIATFIELFRVIVEFALSSI